MLHKYLSRWSFLSFFFFVNYIFWLDINHVYTYVMIWLDRVLLNVIFYELYNILVPFGAYLIYVFRMDLFAFLS